MYVLLQYGRILHIIEKDYAHQHNSCNYDLDSFSDKSEDNSDSKCLKTICLTSV